MPKLSVITIVYNNVRDIERTIRSIRNQSFQDFEYIVIDGASTDGTLDVLNRYKEEISILISEPDRGIYDAMNKGLNAATGEYVLFMNSADEVYDHDTFKKVFASAHNADIYYGETEMYNEQWKSLGRRRHRAPKSFNYKSFRYGMNISHQAIYIKRALCEPYDLQYKYSADIDWIIKIAKKAKHNVRVPGYVAKYLVGGMSKKKHRESLLERYHIFKKHYGFLSNLFNHMVIAFNLGWYYLIHRRTND